MRTSARSCSWVSCRTSARRCGASSSRRSRSSTFDFAVVRRVALRACARDREGSRLPRSAGMKARARVVVIGGGVGGCSIAYWLTKLGERDVVLVERADLTSGSTFHSAGLVGQLRGSLSLTKMMMRSVELYRSLEAEVGLETGWREVGSLRLASTQERDGGARAPGRLGEDVRAAARADLRRGGAAALPADDDRRRARRGVPPHRRLHRPEPADLRARGGRASRRRGDRDEHARHRDHGRARARDRRRDGQGRDRGGDRRQRGRHVREGARRARRRQRPGRPDGARVPRHEAVRPPARDADDARPVAPRLLPSRVGRPRRRRLRARPGAVVARRDPGGLQRPPARRGLAALRAAARERDRARARPRRDGVRPPDQRPRGVHARQRVHPRPDRRARLLGRGRVLRARPRRRGRDGAARRGVDPRRRAEPRRLGDGLAALRHGVPHAASTRSRARSRSTRRTTTCATRATSARPGDRFAPRRRTRACRSSAQPSARSPAGSGRTGSSRTPPPATSRCAREAGPAGSGRRRSARSTARRARPPRSSTRRASRRSRSPAKAPPTSSSASATTRSPATSARSPTPRC